MNEYDLNFRPPDYWSNEGIRVIANIKGEERKRRVIEMLSNKKLDDSDSWMLSARLTGEQRDMLGKIHPALMGGEYLPDCLPDEVEIARISMESVTADVISFRARREGDRFQYRIVDEYETEYNISSPRSELPLTLGELITLIDCAEGDGTESFVNSLRRNWDPDGQDPQAALALVTVTSMFYPGLTAYYHDKAAEWMRKREKSSKSGGEDLQENEQLPRLNVKRGIDEIERVLDTGTTPDKIRHFAEYMTNALGEPATPGVDAIIETLEILKGAVWAHDKDRAFEAVTVLLLGMMKFCEPNPEAFKQMLPLLKKLKNYIEDKQFADASGSVLGFLAKFRAAKAERDGSDAPTQLSADEP